MSLRCLSPVLLLCGLAAARGLASPTQLRICADPDNPPFSERSGQGFDNRIGMLVAHDLGREPVFVWTRIRRGFTREQFNKGACDVLMGVPADMRALMTTEAYYRSAYVFVTRAREHLEITSFSDPHLDGRRIGLQILEEDMSPPSLPLIRSGHAGQLVGFESFGQREGDVVRAVADGRVGAAVVWGPVAGYFASKLRVPLTLTPVSPEVDGSGIPFAFSMSFGVHRNDAALRDALNGSIRRLQPRIDRILAGYDVPLLRLAERAR